jgi:hypothetical protein
MSKSSLENLIFQEPNKSIISTVNYLNKTREELIAICKEKKINGYSGKKKGVLIEMIKQRDAIKVSESMMEARSQIDIEISDCFISPYLKLSNGKNGHGERRLYTGDSHEKNEKLTRKPWIIKYSENYYNEIEPLLNNQEKFAKDCPNRAEIVLKNMTILESKKIYVTSQNGTKDVRRYYIGPSKSNKENVKLWDSFRNTIIPKEYYLQLVEFDDYFECEIISKERQSSNNKKKNSVSNTQIEYFKYLEKTLGIEIQGGHNGIEFQLRNPENGYYWPIDGIHVCGNHKCSGDSDLPCSYNKHTWEFQGDYFHGNPKLYDKDSKFHNITFEKKWVKDKKKKEYYEMNGYIVNIVWESEWTDLKKELQSQGKTWRV